MARPYFMLARAGSPSRFNMQPATDGKLFAINDIWDQTIRTPGPSLLFRVRSDKAPHEIMDGSDTVEWCMGLIDSTTRWRVACNTVRVVLNALRHPLLQQACWQALNVVTGKHQAAVSMNERQAAAKAVQMAVEEAEKTPTHATPFEAEIATMVARFCFVDSDYEAVQMLPDAQVFALNVSAQDEDGRQRLNSLMTLMSSMTISEAHCRLCERLPEWLYAPMPTFGVAGSENSKASRPATTRGSTSDSDVPDETPNEPAADPS